MLPTQRRKEAMAVAIKKRQCLPYDNEGKRDRKFGGCVSALPCARDAVRNMRVTAKQRGREQEAGKYLRFVLNLISGGTILCVES